MAHTQTMHNKAVADAAIKGLTGMPKHLPSWLFYDQEGDHLFQQIMRMPEYYPTRCEYDILQRYKDELLVYFTGKHSSFRLIELGAGDGLKTEILLRHFIEHKTDFTYLPVDISANALQELRRRLLTDLPGLRIDVQNKSYDEALVSLRNSNEKKVILFMGANIGNFTVAEAADFLKKLAIPLQKDDMLFIGFDLKKDPRTIVEAYDDPRGLTASFNLNILRRLNRELDADFDLQNFSHYPFYDPQTGSAKSFLISLKDQDIHIGATHTTIHFDAWESVQTEVSQKYDVTMIEKLMTRAGLNIVQIFFDADDYFCDVIARSA